MKNAMPPLARLLVTMMRALVCLVLLAGADAHAADYLSPISLVASRDGKRLYVAEATAKQVATVDLESGKLDPC